MSESRIEALVLSDAEGNLYEIPCDELLAYRVSAERAAVLERMLTGDEVAGYALNAFLQLRDRGQSQTAGSESQDAGADAESGQLPFAGAVFQVPPVA
jgi:hypothetical protein